MVAVSCRIPCKEPQGRPLCPLKQQARLLLRRPTSRQRNILQITSLFHQRLFPPLHPPTSRPALSSAPASSKSNQLCPAQTRDQTIPLFIDAGGLFSFMCVLSVVDRQSSQNLSLHHAFIFRRPPLDHLDG